MSTCSLRRAALAALAVFACGGLAPPAAGAATGALTATLEPAEGQPVAGMIHMYPNGTNHPSRARLRALIGGLPAGAPVAIIVNRVGGTDDLWVGTADPDGVVAVGIERPLPAFTLDLDSVGSLGVVYDGDGHTGTHEVTAPIERVRPAPAGTRPEVLLATLHGSGGDGENFYAMLHYDNGDPGPGVMSYIARVSECEPASYSLSIVGPLGIRNFMDYTDDSCMHAASGREILVDDTTWALVAHNNSDLVLSRIVDGAAIPLASTQGVRVGKLLGVAS